MKDKHDYTVKTYYDTTDEEHIVRDSAAFFANKYSIFEGQNYFFDERAKIARGEKDYICGFCKHRLRICGGQGNKKQTLHFRHFSGENKGCIYEEEKPLTREEVLRIKYNGAKESRKHEEYKNFVAERLLSMTVPKLFEQDVLVEKIYRSETVPREWRKPDVLAKFPDKTIAFELQLSTTFLNVITEREIFYQKQKIFIFWIFDSFSAESEEQLFAQKDILVSNVYNVFVLDKEAMERSVQENTIYLRCYYVDFKIENGKILGDNMKSKLVSLSELTFRETDYKVFYIDAIEQRNKLEQELEAARKVDEVLHKMDDIHYNWWNWGNLQDDILSIDISTVFPDIKNILRKIEEHGSIISMKNGISLARLLIHHPAMKGKNKQLLILQKYLNELEAKMLEKCTNEIISLLKEESPRTAYEISTLSDKALDILYPKVQSLANGLMEYDHSSSKKKLSVAHFLLRTSGVPLSDENRANLSTMLKREKEKERKRLLTMYEERINGYIEKGSLEGLIGYYYNQIDSSSQHLFTEALSDKYRRLFFHPTLEVEKNVYFYINLLKSPSLWFDIQMLFSGEKQGVLDFMEVKHCEGDSRQSFVSAVLFCLFRSGYELSPGEKKIIKEKIVVAKTDKTGTLKNELLNYSLLQCYRQIQETDFTIEKKQESYKLLYDNWTFISRILSVLMHVVIGCDLANMASIADNMKSFHLEYAHLFVLAAESHAGKQNKYMGNKKIDNLEKLKNIMGTDSKYKKDNRLDSLMPVLFPNVETFNSLKQAEW